MTAWPQEFELSIENKQLAVSAPDERALGGGRGARKIQGWGQP